MDISEEKKIDIGDSDESEIEVDLEASSEETKEEVAENPPEIK